MPSSTPNPKTNPAIELLLAYDEADLMAAVHFQALHHQQYPVVLCWSGSRLDFKRRYRRLLAYSPTRLPTTAMAYGDAFDDHLDRCQPGRAELQPAPRRWPRRVVGAFLSACSCLCTAAAKTKSPRRDKLRGLSLNCPFLKKAH